jgi:hypothetical protein
MGSRTSTSRIEYEYEHEYEHDVLVLVDEHHEPRHLVAAHEDREVN